MTSGGGGGGGKLVGHGVKGGSGVSCYNKRDGMKPVDFYKELNHPIFKSIRVVHNPPLEGR